MSQIKEYDIGKSIPSLDLSFPTYNMRWYLNIDEMIF